MKVKDLLWALLLRAIKYLTPPMKDSLCDILMEWDKKAHETPNKADDMLIQALRTFFNCPDPTKPI